jgi:hypothetical protein
MDKIDDGGPAYPADMPPTLAEEQLRDWFAGQAIGALLETWGAGDGLESYAEEAYRCADAMLEARKS